MIEKFEQYNSEYIVSLHGRNFHQFPITSYYRSPHNGFRCLGNVNKDTIVHFGGTGVMMFHTDLLKFSYEDILEPNMADIWVAKFANTINVKIMCLNHLDNFLGYQSEVGNETIFDNHKFNDSIQTNLTNSIYVR